MKASTKIVWLAQRGAIASLLLLLGASDCPAKEKTTFATQMPFHDCRGLICVDVALDGSPPRTLLLDTGNVNSTVVSDVAAAAGWKLESIVRGGKPLPGVQRGGTHTVHLGAVKSNAQFLVFDRSVFGDNPPPAEGTLAYTFFKDRILQIDYPNHVVRISDVLGASDNLSAEGEIQLITFGKKGPPIVVGAPFTINGKTLRAQIDTCYTGTLLVYDAAAAALGLKHLSARGSPEFFPDTDGGVTMLAAPAENLGFGREILIDRGAKVYFPGQGKNVVHQPDGLFEGTVGNALFRDSVVTLDFHLMKFQVQKAHRHLNLRPNA